MKVGTGKHTYELVETFAKLPEGETFGLISRVHRFTEGRRAGSVLGAAGENRARRLSPAAQPRDLARWEVPPVHGMGIDAKGNIYVGLMRTSQVDKYARLH